MAQPLAAADQQRIPHGGARECIGQELAVRHMGKACGQRDHGAQQGRKAQQEHNPLPMATEEGAGPLYILPLHCQPPAPAVDQGLQPAIAPFIPRQEPYVIAQRGADRPGQQQRPELHGSARNRHAAQPHDQLGRYRGEDVFDHHQQHNAEIVAPLDHLQDDFVHCGGDAPFGVGFTGGALPQTAKKLSRFRQE